MSATKTDRMDNIFGDHSVNELEFALGQIPSCENVYIHGSCNIVSTTVNTALWELGGAVSDSNLFPSSTVTCYVSSSNVLDIGTIIKVIVLDSNYNRQTLGVTLNGQTPVALAIPVTRIMYAESYNADLAGDVYFGDGTATLGVQPLINTMAYIKQGENATHQGAYTVPAGYSLYIKKFYGATSNNDEVFVQGSRSTFGMTHFIKCTDIFLNSNDSQVDIGYYRVEEKTDVILTARSLSNTATAHGGLICVLAKNSYLTN